MLYWLIVLVLIPLTVIVGCAIGFLFICFIAGLIHPKKEIKHENSK
jgi:hypothetical protein